MRLKDLKVGGRYAICRDGEPYDERRDWLPATDRVLFGVVLELTRVDGHRGRRARLQITGGDGLLDFGAEAVVDPRAVMLEEHEYLSLLGLEQIARRQLEPERRAALDELGRARSRLRAAGLDADAISAAAVPVPRPRGLVQPHADRGSTPATASVRPAASAG